MNKLEKNIYVLILAVSMGGMLAAVIDPIFFETVYAREDGLIESSTALALLCASIVSFLRVIKLKQNRSHWFLAVTLGCGFVFLFGAGEEISWGQRIFNFTTPDALAQVNAQGEMNLHNVAVGGVKLNKLIFSQLLGLCLFVYFLIIPLLYSRKTKYRRLCDQWAIPIPTGKQIVLYFIFSAFISVIPQQRKWEVLEFAGSMMFWMILLYPKNFWIFDPKINLPHSHKPLEQ